MKYRSEIDGLRAVAVIPVILFHAGFQTFSGGYVGVDVFFVISGYLITSIIFGKIQDGSFSIIQFYERRARRIMPALLVVCLACIPFGWQWMMASEFEQFANSLIAVSLFVSNVFFWSESGYFASAAELKPLLHTWSLAVEEQFYVVFPLFLLLLRKLNQQALLLLLIFLTVMSLGLADWGSRTHPSANFYLIPSRAWELGIGAILAISSSSWIRVGRDLAEIGSLVGFSMIFYSIFVFDEHVPFPSVWALLPVLGTALVIVCARTETIIGRALSWRPIVMVGLISYSAYLWHVPLFVFARIRLLNGVSSTTYLGLSALALILAYLSWRFVEQPFRVGKTFSRVQVFSGAGLVSLTIISFALFINHSGGASNRIPSEVQKTATWADERNQLHDNCVNESKNSPELEPACVYGKDASTNYSILGDSHAESLANELFQALPKSINGLKEYTRGGCVPVLNVRRSDGTKECEIFNAGVQQRFLSGSDPETIVLLGRWALFIEGKRFNNTEGGKEYGDPVYLLPLDKGSDYISDASRINEVGRHYRESIQGLLNSGNRVVLVYSIPEVGWDVPNYLARERLFGVDRDEPLSTSYDVYKVRVKNAHEQLDMLGTHPNLIRIRPERIFCNSFISLRCVASLNGLPLYFDDDHLSSVGAAMLSEEIVKAMSEKGWF